MCDQSLRQRIERPRWAGRKQRYLNQEVSKATASVKYWPAASLRAFERFVCIMSVFEALSDEDCQSLLRCSRQEIVMAEK